LEMNNLTPSYTRQGMKISTGSSDGGYDDWANRQLILRTQ
jgi:hypothetical protein